MHMLMQTSLECFARKESDVAYICGELEPHYPVPAIPLRTTIQSYGVWIERDNEGLPWTVYQELAPD